MTNLSSDFELPLAVPENIHFLTSLPTLSSIICLMFCQFCYWKLQSDFIPILKILSEIAYYFLVSCSFASILLWITAYDYLKNSYAEWNYTYHLIGNSYTGLLMSFLPASVALSHVVSDLWKVTFTSCKWQEKSRTHNPILFHLIWFHKASDSLKWLLLLEDAHQYKGPPTRQHLFSLWCSTGRNLWSNVHFQPLQGHLTKVKKVGFSSQCSLTFLFLMVSYVTNHLLAWSWISWWAVNLCWFWGEK